jgi:hypothetical protein
MKNKLAAAALSAAAVLLCSPATAQEALGNKLLGTLGLDAGQQVEPGLYISDRFGTYSSDRLVDRNGNDLPVGFDASALAGAIGVSGTLQWKRISTYVTVSAALPIAHVSVNTDRPSASIDRFGFGDLYLEPLQLGWRTRQLDVIAGYALYVPTGGHEPGGTDGAGKGYLTQEPSLGSTVWFDSGRTWKLSARASWDFNSKVRNVDVTRGETVQVQGGFGKTFFRVLDVGVAAYALWQVTDDSGSALPPAVRGARDRAYGLGPEIDLSIPAIRARLLVRYMHDVAVESRPFGQLLLFGLAVNVWRPSGN